MNGSLAPENLSCYAVRSIRAEVTGLYGDHFRLCASFETLDSQCEPVKAVGATKLFEETASCARVDRRHLTRLSALLSRGDVVLVTRLDRVAASTHDLLNVLAAIADRGASFRSLTDRWADTTTPHQKREAIELRERVRC